jgi:hypothetical protein
VTLFGNKNRASAKNRLVNQGKKDFETGQTDMFRVHSNYVGPLSKIRIEHDNSGQYAGCKFKTFLYLSLKLIQSFSFKRVFGQSCYYRFKRSNSEIFFSMWKMAC